jgi:DNA-binding MarR family transcriptional regulator
MRTTDGTRLDLYTGVRTLLVLLEGATTQALAPLDLTPLQFDTLKALFADRGLRMGDLREVLLCDDSTLTRAVGHLHDRSWVATMRDPVDGRATLASITESGIERRSEAVAAHDLALGELIDELDPALVDRTTEGVRTMSQLLLEQEGF